MVRENIKVSVIVPVYDVSNYLRRCLDSILAQSLREIEVIVVNDASPDPLDDEICRGVRAEGCQGNLSGAQEQQRFGWSPEHGCSCGNGEYIGFVDSDDYIHPDMYKTMYEHTIQGGFDIVQCNINLVDTKYKCCGTFLNIENDMVISGLDSRLQSFFEERC